MAEVLSVSDFSTIYFLFSYFNEEIIYNKDSYFIMEK